jgi:hypothetical protein
MTHAFFTIGHSRRQIAEFVDLLREMEIQLVVAAESGPVVCRFSPIW